MAYIRSPYHRYVHFAEDAFKLLENVASPSKLQYSVVYNMTDLKATVITDNDWEKRTTAALSRVKG